MSRLNRFLGLCLLAAVLFLAVGSSLPALAGESGQKRILILHSYHPDLEWTRNIHNAIQEVFAEKGEANRLHVEYLDAKRYQNPDYLSHILSDLFRHKLANLSFDLILLSDNDALNFALEHRQELFPGVPIVFCGVNNFEPSMITGFQGVTGVAESVRPQETIELALRLHPGTKEIVALNSTGDTTGRKIRERFLAATEEFRGRVRFTFWDNLPLDVLREKLRRLPEDRLVFLNGIIEEKPGGVLSYVEGLQRIRPVTPVPLYGYWDFFVGHGIVGGKLISGAMQGRIAAEMGLRVLRGEDPEDFPVVYSGANAFIFDYHELRRFGVPLESLPEGSTVINRPSPFYKVSKEQWWGAVILISSLLVISVVLVVNIHSRKKAEKASRESQRKFRGLFDQSFHFVGLIRPDGTLLEINRTACDFLGIEESAVLGKPFWETPWWGHAPNLQDQLREAIERAAAGETPRFGITHIGSDGGERYFDMSLKPIRDETGQVVLLIPESRDITERKRAEEDLRSAYNQLEKIIEFLPDATFVIDQDKK